MRQRNRTLLEFLGAALMLILLTFILVLLPATCASGNDLRIGPELDTSRAIIINQPIMNNGLDNLGRQLMNLSIKDATLPVTLIISSPGGNVNEGLRFIDIMKMVKHRGTEIRCVVAYGAASMAFQILTHCSSRVALTTSMFLWHQPMIALPSQIVNRDIVENVLIDLRSVEVMILGDLENLPMDKDLMLLHYHRGTMHYAAQIQEFMPGWVEIYDVIPGLLELNVESIPHLEVPIAAQGGIQYIDPVTQPGRSR